MKTFLQSPRGIPSCDTFNRVFATLDSKQLEQGFAAWVASTASLTAGAVVAIDGKALRGMRDTGRTKVVHMVSAWSETNNLMLAQHGVDGKSNEINAIPKLLETLELTGTVVTIDGIGRQREIVEKTADTSCLSRATRVCWPRR